MSGPLCASHVTDGRDYWFTGGVVVDEIAKAICARCPVRDRCAQAGRDERFGIFGGISAGDRWQLMILATPVPEVIHDRTRYVSAGCRCAPCTASNAAYVSAWRQRPAVVTERSTVVSEQLLITLESA